MKVSFKMVKKGDNKGNVVAILPNTTQVNNEEICSDEDLVTYVLFDKGLIIRNKSYLNESRNASIKEYSATKNRLEKDFGLQLEVTSRVTF